MTYIDICSFLFNILKFGEQVEIVFLDLYFPLCKIISTVTSKLFIESQAKHLQFLLKKKVLDFWSLTRFKFSSACLLPLWNSSNLSFISS